MSLVVVVDTWLHLASSIRAWCITAVSLHSCFCQPVCYFYPETVFFSYKQEMWLLLCFYAALGNEERPA